LNRWIGPVAVLIALLLGGVQAPGESSDGDASSEGADRAAAGSGGDGAEAEPPGDGAGTPAGPTKGPSRPGVTIRVETTDGSPIDKPLRFTAYWMAGTADRKAREGIGSTIFVAREGAAIHLPVPEGAHPRGDGLTLRMQLTVQDGPYALAGDHPGGLFLELGETEQLVTIALQPSILVEVLDAGTKERGVTLQGTIHAHSGGVINGIAVAEHLDGDGQGPEFDAKLKDLHMSATFTDRPVISAMQMFGQLSGFEFDDDKGAFVRPKPT